MPKTSMSIQETIDFWKESWDGMPTMKDVMSSMGQDIGNFGRNLSNKVSDKFTNASHKYDDGIFVEKGTRTLLGEDFSTLYASTIETSAISADGWDMVEISGNTGYGTEMMSANLSSSSSRRSIETMTSEQRAAYEIVLLSKQCASLYSPDADASNDAVAQNYTNRMVDYRQYCETNGIDWQQVMSYASWELQTQSLEYKEDSKGLYNPQVSEDNRIISNRAHSMMLECAPDGWEDTLLPHLSSRISYEDTLDTDTRSVSFLGNIGQWFADKWEGVKNFVTAPWRMLKEASPKLIETADKIIVAGELQHEENMKAYQQTGTEIKEKAEDTVDAAKDKAQELYDKATDYLGISDEEELSSELQAGE